MAAWDVAIVGGGLAGWMAALSAAELGRRVVLLEGSRSLYGAGNTRMASGSFMAGDLAPTAEPHRLLERALQTGVAVPELADAWARNSADALAALRSAGVRVHVDGTGHHWLEHYSVVNLGPVYLRDVGRSIIRSVYRACLTRGVQVLVDHRVNALELSAYGAPIHVLSNHDTIAAGTVIVASGGFSANRQLLVRYIGPGAAQAVTRCAPSCRGDALSMLLLLGADTINASYFYGHLMVRGSLSNKHLWPYPRLDDILKYGILVDANGLRFTDEGLGDVATSNAVAGLDEPRNCVLIFDDAAWRADEQRRFAPLGLPNLSDVADQLGDDLVFSDDLQGLAGKLDVDCGRLTATVTTCAESLGSAPRSTAWPSLRGRLYGLRVVPGISTTLGGVRVDGRMRVLDRVGTVIPGVHAAGDAIGGLMGGPAGGYLGGLLQAAVTGLIAGRGAARARLAAEGGGL